MSWETRHVGRRSKLEIACDVLRTISKGVERPTRIMSLSNLTWPMTISYLGSLIRGGFVSEESFGYKHAYRLTPKGSALLTMYTTLQDAAESLELNKLAPSLITRVTEKGPQPAKGGGLVNLIRQSLERAGYHSLPNAIRGDSKALHQFDLVMSGPNGLKNCYLVLDNPTDLDVIRAFVMKVDCETKVTIICKGRPQNRILDLLRSSGIGAIQLSDLVGNLG